MEAGERLIEIDFPGECRARARLLEGLAPATCRAIWDLAGREPEMRAVHAAFTGREISVPIPAGVAAGLDGPEHIPPENLTLFPLPGDLVWAHVPPYAWSGVREAIFDLGIFYGRDSRLLLPVGWLPGNRFAEVLPEDLAGMAALGARMQLEGARQVVIRRLTAGEESHRGA